MPGSTAVILWPLPSSVMPAGTWVAVSVVQPSSRSHVAVSVRKLRVQVPTALGVPDRGTRTKRGMRERRGTGAGERSSEPPSVVERIRALLGRIRGGRCVVGMRATHDNLVTFQ